MQSAQRRPKLRSRASTTPFAAEPRFAGTPWRPDEAVAHARQAGPHRTVILADTQHNPGGGGSSETTGLLPALIAARVERAVLALLSDPGAAAWAHAEGAGAILRGFALGGRHGPAGVEPLVADWEVVRVASGRFTATGPMCGGNWMELGPMALPRPLAAPWVVVAVSSRRLQAAERAILVHLGIDPAHQRIQAPKSSVHFRADFAALADEFLIVAAPGANVADPAAMPYRHLPDGMRRRPQVHSQV